MERGGVHWNFVAQLIISFSGKKLSRGQGSLIECHTVLASKQLILAYQLNV